MPFRQKTTDAKVCQMLCDLDLAYRAKNRLGLSFTAALEKIADPDGKAELEESLAAQPKFFCQLS